LQWVLLWAGSTIRFIISPKESYTVNPKKEFEEFLEFVKWKYSDLENLW